MDERTFSKAISVLGGRHSLRILAALRDGEWRIASDVARGLDIHTTTASKHLQKMHELGFLDRRVRNAKTRKTFEYHLRSTRLTLELDMTRHREPVEEAMGFYTDFIAHTLRHARAMGWPGIEQKLAARLDVPRNGLKGALFTRILEGRTLKKIDELKSLFGQIAREIQDICGSAMGEVAASRLLERALEEASEGRGDIVHRFRLSEPLGVA